MNNSYLAFNKEWFERHQLVLLWFLNHKFTKRWFRWVLRIRKHDVGYNGIICDIQPNNYKVFKSLVGDKIELTADFRTHEKYAKRIYYAFRPIWWSLHFWDWLVADRFVPQWSFGFSTLTAYPDPDTETTTVDGRLRQTNGSGTIWATIRAAAGTSASDNGTSDNCTGYQCYTASNRWREMYRSIFLFDTSGIGAGATINSAVMSLYGFSKSDGSSSTPDIDVYTSTPASNTSLANGDYAQIGTTSQTGSPITYASWTNSGYNDFTFNGTGRGNISLTGVSKFGCRNASYDVANVLPAWVSSQTSSFQCYYADQTGTSNDPKLVVDYTAAGAAGQPIIKRIATVPGLAGSLRQSIF